MGMIVFVARLSWQRLGRVFTIATAFVIVWIQIRLIMKSMETTSQVSSFSTSHFDLPQDEKKRVKEDMGHPISRSSSSSSSSINISHVSSDGRTNERQLPWYTRLAMERATNPVSITFDHEEQPGGPILSATAVSTRTRKYAVLLQLGVVDLWPELMACLANVAAAGSIAGELVDVHIMIPSSRDAIKDVVQADLQKFKSIHQVTIQSYANYDAAGVGAFLDQLKHMNATMQKEYHVVLIINSDSDPLQRERSIESLCGTPDQILSIWKHFMDLNKPDLDLIWPLGTVAVLNATIDVVSDNRATPVVGRNESASSMHNDTFWFSAGNKFWVRHSALISALPALAAASAVMQAESNRSCSSKLGNSPGLLLERIVSTEIHLRKRYIAEIAPAPRPLGIYFPQYHQFPENDKFWGEGFSDWTWLRPSELEGIRKPLSEEEGGLGYYNLLNRTVRKKQGDLARKAGMSGFVYYHYWFFGKFAPKDRKVMYKVIEAMLEDGEPNMPFVLSWANHPWTVKWNGRDDTGGILLSQEYGDEQEWRDHFNYLLKFFRHKNYICVQGKPVFIIYRIDHIAEYLVPMVTLWRKMAVEAGFPGIHLVETIGCFPAKQHQLKRWRMHLDAAFHFWSCIRLAFIREGDSSTKDLIRKKKPVPSIQYWGASTGMDKRVREKGIEPFHVVNVSQFGIAVKSSFQAMSRAPKKNIGQNLYFIGAWNEWNLQSVLEPDNLNKFGYLKSLQGNLQNMPIQTIN